jgi:hypothetical protein
MVAQVAKASKQAFTKPKNRKDHHITEGLASTS